MSRRDEARAIAEAHAESARALYEDDGFVWPVVVLMAEQASVFANPLAGCELPTHQAFGFLTYVLARAIDPEYVITVQEAWQRFYDEDEEPPEVESGYLAAIADVDPAVRSSVQVIVYDVVRDEFAWHVSCVPVGDPRAPTWEVLSEPGMPNGPDPDVIPFSLRMSRSDPHPDLSADARLDDLCEWLAQRDYADIMVTAVP